MEVRLIIQKLKDVYTVSDEASLYFYWPLYLTAIASTVLFFSMFAKEKATDNHYSDVAFDIYLLKETGDY